MKATYEESVALVYSLRSGAGREFEVDSVSGDVHTRRPLDHETSTRSEPVYVLDVCVFVYESPSVFDCVNVSVHVMDANDNRPVVHRV